MSEFLSANDGWLTIVGYIVLGLFLYFLYVPDFLHSRKQARELKLLMEQHKAKTKIESEEWLAGVMDRRRKAQAQNEAWEKYKAGLRATEPSESPRVDLTATVSLPPLEPTIPLLQPTRSVTKPEEKARPRDLPGHAPEPWQVDALLEFRNLRLIGSGGFADVFYGENETGSPRAIKLLRRSGPEKELAKKLFRREARMLSELSSPYMPRLTSSHVDSPRPYFVMDYIDGTNLSAHVRANGPVTNPVTILNLAYSIADALSEMHREGFIHRDIKPHNIMVSRSGFKLIDLGIGKDLRSHSTSSRARMGTTSYMAREYMNGRPASTATDLFSWGAMVGFAMTGLQPYGKHPEHVLMRRVSDGHLDSKFLKALEDFKLGGFTQLVVAYAVGVAIRIDPSHCDLNFQEMLSILGRLHRESSARPSNSDREIIKILDALAEPDGHLH